MGKRAVVLGILVVLQWWVLTLVQTPVSWALTENQKLLLESWRLVNRAYVDESFNGQNWWLVRQKLMKRSLDTKEDTYGAIAEMLTTLEDPFTRFLRPEQYRSLKVSTSGELSGVGLQINVDEASGYIQVITPLVGSPGETAGIRARDLIVAIDGESTKTLGLEAAAAKMRGPVGSRVTLTVQTPNEGDRLVSLVRETVELNPVLAQVDDQGPEKIGYLRLNQFSANAATEMQKAIQGLERQKVAAYVLDLRNNPGGLLQSGIAIAQQWLDQGVIVYTVNRQGVFGVYETQGPALTEKPLVVLVNGGTASASEILSGALQDNGRALLVGEKTFGKGLIQSLFELSDDSGLAVTVAKYETPDHHDINKLGIQPDVTVEQKPIPFQQATTAADHQYQAAVQLLRSPEQWHHWQEELSDRALWIRTQ